MKCPKCESEHFAYTEKNKKGTDKEHRWIRRKSNLAKCKKCGFEGET